MIPAISAMTVFPNTIQEHFGIPGTLGGMIIDEVTPNSEAKKTVHLDEDTTPAVMIFSERKLSFEIKGKKKSRSNDICNSYPGVQIDSSSLTWITSGISQGFASSYAGRIFVLDAPKVTLKKGELDDYSFTLDAFGYTLPRFAA